MNSDRMVLLNLNIKPFALDFNRITVIETSFITGLKSQQHILIFKYKNCWNTPWSSAIIWTNISFRNKGRRFRFLSYKLKLARGKKHYKILLRENKFHTYLTRETLPAEGRVRKFHNHGKTPSYQTFADASMRKVEPRSCGRPLKGRKKAPLRFKTGTECHDNSREIVGRSRQNCLYNCSVTLKNVLEVAVSC